MSIWGVCSTRDIFELGQPKTTNYHVERYGGNLNPLSAVSESPASEFIDSEDPCFQEAFADLSNFNKRMLSFQINKGAFGYFDSQRSDWLVLDAGALRFDLLKYEFVSNEKDSEKRYIYIEDFLSKNLKKLCDLGAIPGSYERIGLSAVADEEFERCMEEFCEKILQIYDEPQIILNEIYPVPLFLNDSELTTYQTPLVLKQRSNMSRGYRFLKKRLPEAHLIEFPCYMLADVNHKWGLGALHYVPEYYDYGLKAMDCITRNCGSCEEEKEKLHELKIECEEKTRRKYERLLLDLTNANAAFRVQAESQKAEIEELQAQSEELEDENAGLRSRAASLEKEVSAAQLRVEELSGVMKAQKAVATQQSAEIERQKAEIDRLHESNSWKIGRAITWLPQKMKKLVKGRRTQ